MKVDSVVLLPRLQIHLLRRNSLTTTATSLRSKVETLLITLGGDGFEIATKNGAKKYPCMKIVPVDTTAAGDTLCGGMVAKLAEECALEDAAKFGSKSASIACTRKGAQPSIPTREEVENFAISK